MNMERLIQEKVNMILRNNMKLLELFLMAALNAFKDDPNTYSYLFQKSDFAITEELISRIPNTNSRSHLQSHDMNTSQMRTSKNPIIYSHSYNSNIRYHTQKQKPGDYCYACYNRNTEEISKKYFENLGKEIISDIGLDSFGGVYAAAKSVITP